MSALNLKGRRSAATCLANHPEPCEMRVLLSGTAIYPAQAVVKETPLAPEGTVGPLAVPSDYNGTWDSDGTIYTFSVKGDNPEKGKVKGTVMAATIVGGSVKVKGKITNGDQLDIKMHGKVAVGVLVSKFKAQLSVVLTDSTHFEGTFFFDPKEGVPNTIPLTGVKL